MIEKTERETTLAYELKTLADRRNAEATTQGKAKKLFAFLAAVAHTQAAAGDYEIAHLGTLLHVHRTCDELRGIVSDEVVHATLGMLRECALVVTSYNASDLTEEQMSHGYHHRIAWSKPTKQYQED